MPPNIQYLLISDITVEVTRKNIKNLESGAIHAVDRIQSGVTVTSENR